MNEPFKSTFSSEAFEKAIRMALTVGNAANLNTRDRTTIVNAVNEIKKTASDKAAEAAQLVEYIKRAMNELPDGQAVSALVAQNTARLDIMEERRVFLTEDEYQALEDAGLVDPNVEYNTY